MALHLIDSQQIKTVFLGVLISLSVTFSMVVFGYAADHPKQKNSPQAKISAENMSGYERLVLVIIDEFTKQNGLSGLPSDYAHLLLGGSATLSTSETGRLLTHSKALHQVALAAISMIDENLGRDALMDLLIGSYFYKKTTSFLITAGLDVVGREAFYAELERRRNIMLGI